MPVAVTSDAFESETVLFENKEAANNWRESLVVPDATLSTPGVVSKSTAPAVGVAASATTYVTIQVFGEGGALTETQVVSKDAYDDLKTKYDNLVSSFNTLRTNLINAGVLSA